MPYLKPGFKNNYVRDCPTTPGELNYAITKIVDEYLVRFGPLSYASLNEVVGSLECAKLELYRRVVAPYEDTKIEENGDVYSVAPEERGEHPPARDYDICDDPGCPCRYIPVSDNDIGEDSPPLRGDRPPTCPGPHCCYTPLRNSG